MKTLLIAESAVLALAGLPLAVFPSTTIFLLLGRSWMIRSLTLSV